MKKIIIRAIIKMLLSIIIQKVCFSAYLSLVFYFYTQYWFESNKVSPGMAYTIIAVVILAFQLLVIPVYKIKPLKSETNSMGTKMLKAFFWIFNGCCLLYTAGFAIRRPFL